MHNSNEVRARLPDSRTVVLVDSNDRHAVPPTSVHSMKLMMVVAASPKFDRWGWARKDSNNSQRFYYVPLPLESDIKALAECAQQPNIMNVYRLIGPCPRLLTQFRNTSEDNLTSQYTSWASGLVGNKEKIVAVLDNFGSTAQSHPDHFHCFFYLTGHAFLPGRQPEIVYFTPKHVVGTDFLLHVLRWQLHKQSAQEVEDMLELVKDQRTVFGIFFEAHLLATIKRGHLSNAYYVSDRPEDPNYFPQSQPDATSPFTQEHVLSKKEEEDFPTLDLNQEHHLILVEPNFPTVDGVLLTRAKVQLFQLRVSSRHKLLNSGFERVHEMLAANNMIGHREWHFVFITTSAAAGRQLVDSDAAREMVEYARRNLSLTVKMDYMAVDNKCSFRGQLENCVETTLLNTEGFEEDGGAKRTA